MTPTHFSVGLLHPAEADAGLYAAIDALQQLMPGMRVYVEPYIEPTELRLARSIPKPDLAALSSQAPLLTPTQLAVFSEVDAVMAVDLPFNIGSVAPKLKFVQSIGAGTAQLQSAGLAEAGIRLASSAGTSAIAIAEFVIARILQEWKRLREIEASFTEKCWNPHYGEQLAGRTIGLIGLGAINRAVATRCKALGLKVMATRRSSEHFSDVDKIYAPTELDAMLAESDIVVSAVPETSETNGLMGRDRFSKMRQGAYFCNVGRGSLVDEAALIEALESGKLRAAALDVTREEPLPSGHPLWEAPNLYLSSHCAADVQALFPKLHQLFRENLQRFWSDQPLINEVKMDRGY